MVGLLPVLAVAHARTGEADTPPDLTARLRWLQRRRPELLDGLITRRGPQGEPADHLLALLDSDRLQRVLTRMFDEQEFLSPHGIRSLSAAYRDAVQHRRRGTAGVDRLRAGGVAHRVVRWQLELARAGLVPCERAARRRAAYLPRLPRRRVHRRGADRLRHLLTLGQAADLVDQRLCDLFRVGAGGRRPCDGERIEADPDPLWRDHLTFSEYFDGDTGEGLGATHQTGWTALVAHLLCRPADA